MKILLYEEEVKQNPSYFRMENSKLRKKIGLTQEQLAGEMGISRVYMGYIEQGRESPSLRLLMRLAGKLKVKIQDIFHR